MVKRDPIWLHSLGQHLLEKCLSISRALELAEALDPHVVGAEPGVAVVFFHKLQDLVNVVEPLLLVEPSEGGAEGGHVGLDPGAAHLIEDGIEGSGGARLAKGLDDGIVGLYIGGNTVGSGELTEDPAHLVVAAGEDAGEEKGVEGADGRGVRSAEGADGVLEHASLAKEDNGVGEVGARKGVEEGTDMGEGTGVGEGGDSVGESDTVEVG